MASPELVAACASLDRLHPDWTAVRRRAYPDWILITWDSPSGLKVRADYELQDIPGHGVAEYISFIEVQQICRNGSDVNIADVYKGYFCEGKNQRAGYPLAPGIKIDPDSCHYLRDYVKRISSPILQRDEVAARGKREAERQARATDERAAREKFFGL